MAISYFHLFSGKNLYVAKVFVMGKHSPSTQGCFIPLFGTYSYCVVYFCPLYCVFCRGPCYHFHLGYKVLQSTFGPRLTGQVCGVYTGEVLPWLSHGLRWFVSFCVKIVDWFRFRLINIYMSSSWFPFL